jgi:CubicO group peptidase (beta-lactamase class C family)
MDLAGDITASGLRPRVSVAGRPIARTDLAARMVEANVPAISIAVLDGGKTHTAAWETDVDTRFQAQSISKPLTTMAVMRLVADGVVDLDSDVNGSLRSWRLAEGAGVTLRRLVSHIAGINVHGFDGYEPGTPIPSLVQTLDGVAPANNDPIRVVTPPGTRVEYSGGGFQILQMLLEDLTGQPFATLMRDTLLDPLGMTCSTFVQPLPVAWEADAATGHDDAGQALPGRWRVQPEAAAGGCWATPTDLVRAAAEMCAPCAVLDVAARDAMLTAQRDNQALGWVLDGRWFRHNGDNEGFRAVMVGNVQTGQASAVMANGNGALGLNEDLLATVAELFEWPDYLTERTTVALGPDLLATMPGRYELGPGFDLVIRREGDRLFATADGIGESELLAASHTELFPLDFDAVLRRADAETIEIETTGITIPARRKDP